MQTTAGRRNRAFETPELIALFADLERRFASPAAGTPGAVPPNGGLKISEDRRLNGPRLQPLVTPPSRRATTRPTSARQPLRASAESGVQAR